MGFDRIRIKENAKKHYDLNKWTNVLVAFVYSLIVGAGGSISSSGNSFTSSNGAGVGTSSEGNEEAMVAAAIIVLVVVLIVSLVSFAVSFFVVNPITMGTMAWFQKSIYTEKLGFDKMFDGFRGGHYIANVGAMALKHIYIFLWSLLFVIPGVVKSYSYFMVEYLKMENPNISAKEAIELSNRMTNGHKMDLFVLDLSFLGWNILSSLTCGILGIVYVNPYYFAAKAFAYEEIKADAIAKGIVSADTFNSTTVI